MKRAIHTFRLAGQFSLLGLFLFGACVEDPDILITMSREDPQVFFTIDACEPGTGVTCAGSGTDPAEPFSGNATTATTGIFLSPAPDLPTTLLVEFQRKAPNPDCTSFVLTISELPLEIAAEGLQLDPTRINICPNGVCLSLIHI